MSIKYNLEKLVAEMQSEADDSYQLEFTTTNEEHSPNVPLNVFRLIVCTLGILGNLLVIFVVLVLAEYRKAVTHWYVLQLAIADTIFLLTLPFRLVEDFKDAWIFPVWMCKAKETILFLNYYSSVTFLVVMSIDRYIAVCHGFSNFLQKFRTPFAAGVITVTAWFVCLMICIPIMMYSTTMGHEPNCKCRYNFPKSPQNATETCISEGMTEESDLAKCIEDLLSIPDETCANVTAMTVSGSGFENIFEYYGEETTPSPDEETIAKSHILTKGCHYGNSEVGFKAFVLFNFLVMFVIPLTVMAACYSLIVLRLYRTRFRMNGVGSTDSHGSRHNSVSSAGTKRSRSNPSSKRNQNRLRVTAMCALMVFLFFICWLPFHAVHLAKFSAIEGTTQYCEDLFFATSLVAFSNSAINPYLYNFIGTRFGRRLSSAASAVRESVRKRSPHFSGTVQYQDRRGTTENGTSQSPNATVMTKICKGKSEVTNGEFSSNVFTDTSKQSEEEQHRHAIAQPPYGGHEVQSALLQDLPPDYDNYENEGHPGGSFNVRAQTRHAR